MRGIIDDYRQVDFAVEQLGGKRAESALPIGFLLLTKYQKHIKKPQLKRRSTGAGVLAGVANSISIRQNPRLVVEIISTAARRAIVLEAKRGEAGKFADFLLDYLSGGGGDDEKSRKPFEIGTN